MNKKYSLLCSFLITFCIFSIDLICPFCKTHFRGERAFKNHKKTKAHYQNIIKRLTTNGQGANTQLQSPIKKKTKKKMCHKKSKKKQREIDTIFHAAMKQIKKNNESKRYSSICSS